MGLIDEAALIRRLTQSYPTTGYFPFKAKETGAVRSNIVQVTVTN